jgi:tryptophan synthase alpha subunit
MPNTKAVGVAYEDPYLDGAVINNSTITGTVTSTAVSNIAVTECHYRK